MKTTYFILCLYCASHGYAQDSERQLFGVVIDADTFRPIPFAHVISPKYGTVSGLNGHFMIPVRREDTIVFSHINYRRRRLPLTAGTNDTLKIFLLPIDVLLSEITIRPLPSEEAFKSRY